MKNILNTKVGVDLEPKTNFAEQNFITVSGLTYEIDPSDIGSEFLVEDTLMTITLPSIADVPFGSRITIRLTNEAVLSLTINPDTSDGIAGAFTNGNYALGTIGVGITMGLGKCGDFVELISGNAEMLSGTAVWLIAGSSGGDWS